MEWRCGLIQGKGKEIECWKQLNLPSGIPTKEAVVVMTVLIPSTGEESLLSFWMQIQKRMIISPKALIGPREGQQKGTTKVLRFDTGETDYSIYDVAINGSAIKVDKGRMEQEEQCLHDQHRKGRHIIAII